MNFIDFYPEVVYEPICCLPLWCSEPETPDTSSTMKEKMNTWVLKNTSRIIVVNIETFDFMGMSKIHYRVWYKFI
jgi:hypothetical protein